MSTQYADHRYARPPVASTCLDLLDRSRSGLLVACRTGDAAERYIEAHLGALRAAAALLAVRSVPGRPGNAGEGGGPSPARPDSAGGSSAGGSSAGGGRTPGRQPGRDRATLPVLPTRSRPRSVWEILPRVAPELAEWSAFFAASARRRAAIERGLPIGARESDDLLRQAEVFLEIVQDLLAIPRAEALPMYVAPVSRSGAGSFGTSGSSGAFGPSGASSVGG